jgi:hypothetical protein
MRLDTSLGRSNSSPWGALFVTVGKIDDLNGGEFDAMFGKSMPFPSEIVSSGSDFLSSTLPARKWLISLETGSNSQTTKRV